MRGLGWVGGIEAGLLFEPGGAFGGREEVVFGAGGGIEGRGIESFRGRLFGRFVDMGIGAAVECLVRGRLEEVSPSEECTM